MPSGKMIGGLYRLISRYRGFAVLGCLALVAGGRAWAADPACPVVSLPHLALPATRTAVSHQRPIEVVAFGSSSTEGIGASAPDRTYPSRLEALLRAHWPGMSVTVLNQGIGGQTIDALVARLDADVLAVRPTLVIWQIGTNEAMRGMDPAQFGGLLDEGIKRITAAGSDVILMDYQLAPRMPPEEALSVYREIIAREADIRSVSLFSRAALMREWNAANPAENVMIGPDGLHHSDHGYACLAAALGEAIVTAVVDPAAKLSAKVK